IAHRGGTGGPPADARCGGDVCEARLAARRRPQEIWRGHRRSDAPAQFRAGGGAPDRDRLWTRRSVHLAEARGDGFAYVVRDDSDWETATDACRLVAWLRESALDPVHFTTLVFPAADLDAVSLAGVADRPTSGGYSPRPRRRTRLSFHHHLRFRSLTRGPGRAASRRDGEQDLLRRREADRLQVGTPRFGDNDAFLRARAAAGVHSAPGSHQAHGLGGIRRARPALRSRV